MKQIFVKKFENKVSNRKYTANTLKHFLSKSTKTLHKVYQKIQNRTEEIPIMRYKNKTGYKFHI